MKLVTLMITLVTAFLFSCASTHPGNEGAALSGSAQLPLKMSAQTIDENKKDPFQLVEVTFENTSDEWLRIAKSQVVISNPATSKISVVMGQDLVDWANAMELRRKKEEHNKKLLQTGLLIGSAVVGGVSNDSNVSTAAGLTMVATTVWMVSDSIRKKIRNAESVNQVPDTHLNHSVMIPGNTFVRRWVLLNKPSGTLIKRLIVQTETAEGKKGRYAVDL